MRPLSLFIAMLLLGLLDCRCSQAQNDTMVFFNKTYPNEYVSNGSGITTFCIENMPDGYLLAGSRLSGTADGSITLADIDNIKDHIYLHKIDLHGNTLWKKTS
ncbi:MAG: hypothetical protein IPL35_12150 [Sphingobacteriales bacterium]|nr:hypothetical protein [Sphingobacteriales bacterium]